MKHFSHPHELELWNSDFHGFFVANPTSILPACSCCKFPAFGYDFVEPVYVCMACDFFLHFRCAQFPQLVVHPAHKNHTLALLPAAAYPGGKFNCDACGRQDDGFNYHCSSCEFDLHVNCASKPLQITLPIHSCPLELTFKGPYDNVKGFACDFCRKMGYKEWLYRCGACEFDLHLGCAATVSLDPGMVVSSGQIQPQFLQGGTGIGQNLGMSSGQSHPVMHGMSTGGIPVAQLQFRAENAVSAPISHGEVMRPSFVHASGQSGLVSDAIEGFVEGASQGVGQSLVHGMIGGEKNGGVSGSDGRGDGYGLGAIFGNSSGAQY